MAKIDLTYENNKIKIGKNAEDNDNIIKEAKETDVWFHLAEFPSCHVIIECSKEKPITKQMIYYCGNLVKQNTKYKNIGSLKINYTDCKNVIRTEIKGKVILKGKINNIII